MRPKLSVVLPVYNEADIIENVIKSYYREIIKKFPNSELVIAEDGSTDGTKQILKKMKIKIPIKLSLGSKKKGYLRACRNALESANGELIFFSDSDGQHNPKDFWNLYKKIEEYDIVMGSKSNRKDPFYRKVLSKMYNISVLILFGKYFPDINCGFKLMKREIAENVIKNIKYLKYGFSTELVIRANKMGYKITDVPVRHIARKYGKAEQFAPSKLPKVLYEQLLGLAKLKLELM